MQGKLRRLILVGVPNICVKALKDENKLYV